MELQILSFHVARRHLAGLDSDLSGRDAVNGHVVVHECIAPAERSEAVQ